MSNQEITIIVVIAVVAVLLLLWFFMQQRRSRALRDSFGDEYDRTLETRGNRGDAEADLLHRQDRVSKLDIRPLTASERDRFALEWKETKAIFVDSPIEAVSRADRLLTQIMHTRGFPMSDFEHRHADLTVDHTDTAKHYLAGHEIADRASDATTEELRRAINHYETLFADMTNEVTEIDERREPTARDLDGDGYIDGESERSTADRARRDVNDDIAPRAPTRPVDSGDVTTPRS
ncbi:hypothetical protein [Aurantiacibacter rhizosphaerae]|uniref:Secreted protein n=1 Tax=Aurantiacibacter rhizosphaerae TaxID=2691582 RepID=A0A844XAP7_9SPHN|nr:hypothetical protein [Aurantiacibacter rhizosphaerae]MWV26605.1 hypothetical protein [Aurantiacibacter rhizosphaerae]